MFYKCFSIDISAIWFVILSSIAYISNVEAAGTASGCKKFIIASTFGTFAACLLVFAIIVVALVHRFPGKRGLAESQRRLEMGNTDISENIQFTNTTAITEVSDEYDVTIANPLSLNASDKDLGVIVQSVDHNSTTVIAETGTQTSESFVAKSKQESVTVEKRANGGFGLSLATAGLYVKAIDADSPSTRVSNIEPGDEILAINGTPVEGMTDLEAMALIAKSASSVQLEIIRRAFLWRVHQPGPRCEQLCMKRRARHDSPQCSMSNEEALKKARIEIGEALMELRRCTSPSSKEVHVSCVNSHEKSNSQQSFFGSAEEKAEATEEDFVVIESPVPSQCADISDGTAMHQTSDRENTESYSGFNHDENILTTSDELTQEEVSKTGALHHKQFDAVAEDVQTVSESGIQKDNKGGITSNAKLLPSTKGNARENLSLDELKARHPGGLFSISKSNVARKAKTPDEVPGYRLMNGSASSHGSVASESAVRPYYVVESGQVGMPYYARLETNTSSYIPDLDKIKPPPSYEIASQTFNSQKPSSRPYIASTSRVSPTEYKGIGNGSIESQWNNSHEDSTNSSFDDLDSNLPTMLQMTAREPIDEHVLRYMTKKYSEPRFPVTLSTSNASTLISSNSSVVVGPRFIPPDYSSSSDSADFAQLTPAIPSVTARSRSDSRPSEYDKQFTIDTKVNLQPATSAMSAQNNSYLGLYNGSISSRVIADDTKVISIYNDRDVRDEKYSNVWSLKRQTRRKSPDHVTGSLTDLRRERTHSFEHTSGDVMQVVTANGKLRKISMNRPTRPQRLKMINGETVKNMRRAASSPSVNAESPQRATWTETYNADVDIPPRRQRNQRERKLKDESFDRRKSIDSGSLKKLAAELKSNQSLSDDLPLLSSLLGGLGFPAADRSNNLPRYQSSDSIYVHHNKDK